jgi:hypothetical protein
MINETVKGEYFKNYYLTHKSQILAHNKKYNNSHRELIKQAVKRWREKNRGIENAARRKTLFYYWTRGNFNWAALSKYGDFAEVLNTPLRQLLKKDKNIRKLYVSWKSEKDKFGAAFHIFRYEFRIYIRKTKDTLIEDTPTISRPSDYKNNDNILNQDVYRISGISGYKKLDINLSNPKNYPTGSGPDYWKHDYIDKKHVYRCTTCGKAYRKKNDVLMHLSGDFHDRNVRGSLK